MAELFITEIGLVRIFGYGNENFQIDPDAMGRKELVETINEVILESVNGTSGTRTAPFAYTRPCWISWDVMHCVKKVIHSLRMTIPTRQTVIAQSDGCQCQNCKRGGNRRSYACYVLTSGLPRDKNTAELTYRDRTPVNAWIMVESAYRKECGAIMLYDNAYLQSVIFYNRNKGGYAFVPGSQILQCQTFAPLV